MKKSTDIAIGKRIKYLRSNLKMDQKTFAKKINATVSALSNWENGRNKPNDIMIYEISKLGNITPDELLYGTIEERIYKAIDTYREENKPDVTEKQINDLFNDTTQFFKAYQISGIIVNDREIKNVVNNSFEIIINKNRKEIDPITIKKYTKESLIQEAIISYSQLRNYYESLNNIDENSHTTTIQSILTITDEALTKIEDLKEQ